MAVGASQSWLPACHKGRGVTGLRVSELVWEVAGARYRLDPADLPVAEGTVAAVVAEPPAVAEPGQVLAPLADILVGLAPVPAGGTVSSGGRPVALVPAGGALLPHLTVARNIAYGLPRDAAAAHSRDARVRHLEKRFHLEGALGLRPHRLSPEQRLRVAFARALCAGPAAVVVEDRTGEVPCDITAGLAASENVAVLVLTDAAGRAGPPATEVARVQPAPPGDRPPEPDPAGRPVRAQRPGRRTDPGSRPRSAVGSGEG